MEITDSKSRMNSHVELVVDLDGGQESLQRLIELEIVLLRDG